MYQVFLITFCLVVSPAVFADVDFKTLRDWYHQAPKNWPKPELSEGVEHHELGLVPSVVHPQSNPFSTDKAKLGRRLFFDPMLSRSGQIACANCHDRDLGWADGRTVSFGHDRQAGKRNAPSIENAAFWHTLFWDGRANSLEQQALMPIQDPLEMNFTLPEMVARLNGDPDYVSAFKQVFDATPINAEQVAKALATYQRTIVSRRSDFDYFLLAKTQTNPRMQKAYSEKLSDQALWGLHLFRTKARCMNCHNGPLLSDNGFHNIGLTYYKREYEDLGRYLVTGKASDVGKFKTPSLRGIMNSKPWMHNGLLADMEGVMAIYNAGGFRFSGDLEDPLAPVTSPLLQPLSLNQKEQQALVAFMEALTPYPNAGIVR
ncbi:cytochrome-c peroxidase [Pseudoalteromonas luteoviolacea]|uniref:cytochrome-c peroxidase n=1 Tax=Pseudoalteromonas luteoviolacea TaxID=43657 RepID=UPI001B3791F2|nr:cytochrome c peroxidase [Pseudoalteromonas luteoviolacea]MBQ4813918.1 cytochrome-c peroxidase [Pseudoalteromonas luteoviolacea]